jgi:excisionase family DNA binding protein
MSNITTASPAARAMSVRTFCERYGFGKTRTYELIEQGKLKSVLIGRRRLILAESAEALLRGEGA